MQSLVIRIENSLQYMVIGIMLHCALQRMSAPYTPLNFFGSPACFPLRAIGTYALSKKGSAVIDLQLVTVSGMQKCLDFVSL